MLASDIDKAASLDDLRVAIDRFSDASPHQIFHFGICQIDNTIITDVIYTRPIKGKGISSNDFSEEMKTKVVDEALFLMAPFDLLHHEFQTSDNSYFEPLRAMVAPLELEGVIVIPYKHENTISIIIIHCSEQQFIAGMSNILPSLFLMASKIFARFPTLSKWPADYQLTDREAQVLQIASSGSLEKSIARQLGISLHTVRIHIENAKRKLEARSKTHAILIAAASGEINALTEQSRRK